MEITFEKLNERGKELVGTVILTIIDTCNKYTEHPLYNGYEETVLVNINDKHIGLKIEIHNGNYDVYDDNKMPLYKNGWWNKDNIAKLVVRKLR